MMKTKISTAILLFVLGISMVYAQSKKDFTIEKRKFFYIVKPIYLTSPDFTRSSRYEIMDHNYMKLLIDSVKNGVSKEIIATKIVSHKSKIRLCFDKTGKILYGYFELDNEDIPEEKITLKDLRTILDSYMDLRIDMSKIETNFGPNTKFNFGVLTIPLKTREI